MNLPLLWKVRILYSIQIMMVILLKPILKVSLMMEMWLSLLGNDGEILKNGLSEVYWWADELCDLIVNYNGMK